MTQPNAEASNERHGTGCSLSPLASCFPLLLRRAPFLLAAVIVLASTLFYRPQSYGIWADQMTYYLQANSLAFDGDLQFDRHDLERFRRHGWTELAHHATPVPAKGPTGLFLREANGRFYYSKPFLYSLAAVPFVWLAPVRGLILLNGLLWLTLLEIAFRWYRRFNGPGRAATIAALTWTGCAAPFYIFVIHTDLMIPTLLAMALYLWLTSEARGGRLEAGSKEGLRKTVECGGSTPPCPSQERSFEEKQSGLRRAQTSASSVEPSSRVMPPHFKMGRIAFAGVFFGLALYEKSPLVFFLGAASGCLLWRREWRAAGALLLSALVVFALPTAVHFAQDGHFSPYQGRRVYCDGAFPFDDLEKARKQLSDHRHPGGEFFDPHFGRSLLTAANLHLFAVQLPGRIAYYLVGRKTGLFPYLTPALVALVLWLALRQWRGEGRPTLWIAMALAAYVLFYFLTLSAYYGGPTAIGNRYALQVLPAFLLLVQRFPHTRARFASVVVALAGAALFFPGYDLLRPYGKVRDNLDLLQKPRFRWLPFEWHLAWFMADKESATVSLGEFGKLLRLTDLNPTHSEEGYFTPLARHEVALLTRIPFPEFPISLATHSLPLAGQVRSGRNRHSFALAPHETQLLRLPLSLRCYASYRTLGVYCYSIEIVATSPLESNTIYPEDFYSQIGPFVRWFADPRATSATASVVPDNPGDAGRLLWGWQAPETPNEQGLRVRWAGEATESAVVLRAAQKRDHILRVVAQCPVVMETDVLWNGRLLDTWLISPEKGVFSRQIRADDLREGENVLCLRHRRLWQPLALFGAKASDDDRWLAIHYQRFELEPTNRNE
jgi:hypothetical protein